MKKITIVVCSLMLSVICVFAGITIHQRMSGASGESGVLVHNTDKFAVIAQTGRNVKIGENVDIEELMEGNWDGTMLFAGWFVDQECTEAVTAGVFTVKPTRLFVTGLTSAETEPTSK